MDFDEPNHPFYSKMIEKVNLATREVIAITLMCDNMTNSITECIGIPMKEDKIFLARDFMK